jgi:hypothetical protein
MPNKPATVRKETDKRRWRLSVSLDSQFPLTWARVVGLLWLQSYGASVSRVSAFRLARYAAAVGMLLPLTVVVAPDEAAQAASPNATSGAPAEHLPTSLEAMGLPSEGFGVRAGPSCYSYKTASQGAKLVMGGTTYPRGFQVRAVPQFYICGGHWTWAWHIANDYRTFAAYIGLDSDDTQPATLSFPGPTGKPLTFRADGYLVKQTLLVAGLPTKVTMNVAGTLNLVVETTTVGATIDFGDDILTPLVSER